MYSKKLLYKKLVVAIHWRYCNAFLYIFKVIIDNKSIRICPVSTYIKLFKFLVNNNITRCAKKILKK